MYPFEFDQEALEPILYKFINYLKNSEKETDVGWGMLIINSWQAAKKNALQVRDPESTESVPVCYCTTHE